MAIPGRVHSGVRKQDPGNPTPRFDACIVHRKIIIINRRYALGSSDYPVPQTLGEIIVLSQSASLANSSVVCTHPHSSTRSVMSTQYNYGVLRVLDWLLHSPSCSGLGLLNGHCSRVLCTFPAAVVISQRKRESGTPKESKWNVENNSLIVTYSENEAIVLHGFRVLTEIVPSIVAHQFLLPLRA